MAKKTNKTSHVLNLLTNGARADEADNSGQDTKIPGTHTASSAKVTVVDEGSRNDRVSHEILNKLSEELGEEVPVTTDDLPIEPPVIQEPEPIAEAAPEPEPEPEPLEEILELEPEAEDTVVLKSGGRLSEQLQDEDFRFINAMEELIMQHDLEQILSQYNVCTCTRCKADVCALTLSGLPAKYVVAGSRSLSPVLNYYKNRYRISILAELSKACTTVREHPHHKR